MYSMYGTVLLLLRMQVCTVCTVCTLCTVCKVCAVCAVCTVCAVRTVQYIGCVQYVFMYVRMVPCSLYLEIGT